MSRKQIKHLTASNFMGISDKIKRMRKRGKTQNNK